MPHRALIDRCRHTSDQLTPAFGPASVDRDRHPIDGQCVMAGNDPVDAVRFAAGVEQRTIYLVSQPGDRFSPDIVLGRTANDVTAMIGLVSNCNDLQ